MRELTMGHMDARQARILTIRSWVLAFSAIAAIVIGAVLGAPANAAANPAEAFVQSNIDRGYNILNNGSLSREARRQQFRQFLTTLTDLKRIGHFALGPAARQASDADKQAFYEAFEEYAVAVYGVHLSKYRGQTLKVTGSQQRSTDDVVVNAQVVDPRNPDAQPIKVAFRVRKNDSG
jgi:phospholipid transport system substrate-binding protein